MALNPNRVWYTAIGGTHDWRPDGSPQWYTCESHFSAWMKTQGFDCKRRNGPYWSGALGGIPLYKTRVWSFGANVFAEYMRNTFPNPADRHVISVSHGGQVALMAAANEGLELDSLVTVTMPVRHDLEPVYAKAMRYIRVYTHVYSDSWWRDRWQLLGTIWDGQFRLRRTMPDEILSLGTDAKNIGIPNAGHTDLVGVSKVFLHAYGVLPRLRADVA